MFGMFTARLGSGSELRMIEPHHAAELNKLIFDSYDHLREWSNWLTEKERPIERTDEWIRRNLEKFAAGEGYEIGIWHHDKMAGQIGYNFFDRTDGRTEIGYWLGVDVQGKGLATTACRALINNAFDNLSLNRVEIRCGTENYKSRGVAERLGAVFEGVARQAEWLHDRYIDLAIYAILQAEWQVDASGDISRSNRSAANS